MKPTSNWPMAETQEEASPRPARLRPRLPLCSTVYVLDKDGKILDTNESAVPLTNRGVEDLVGSIFYEMLDPVTGEMLRTFIRACRTAELDAVLGTLADAGGIELSVKLRVMPLAGEDNMPLGFVVHALPVTGIADAGIEAEIDPEYEQLLEQATEAILQIGPELEIRFSNHKGNLMFGWDESEGPCDMASFLDETSAERLSQMMTLAKAGKHQPPERFVFLKDGAALFEGEICLAPYRGGESEAIWAVVKNTATDD